MKTRILIFATIICMLISNVILSQTGESKYKMVIINQNEKKVVDLFPSFKISDLSFTEANKNRSLDGKEDGFISFYVKNTGTILLKQLVINLDLADSTNSITFTKSQTIGQLNLGDSTLVKIPFFADEKLKDGQAQFRIQISDANSDSVKLAQLIIPTKEVLPPPEFTWLTPDAAYNKADFPVVEITGLLKTRSTNTRLKLYINGEVPDDKTEFEMLPTDNLDGYSVKRMVTLNEGDNEIKIEAVNAQGITTFEPIIFNFSALKIDENYVEKRLALVIGNANYASVNALPNPVNDAKAITAALKNVGFTVLPYYNTDFKTMKKAEDEFGEKLADYNVGLFYYAGHGMQVNGRNYLIPVDADPKVEQDVDDDCIDVERVLGKMDAAGTSTNIVILDACRDNPFARSWRSTRSGAGQVNAGLAAITNAPQGTYIAYATAPDQTALDGTGKNGPYTEAIVKFINIPGVKIEDFFKMVRNEVLIKTNKMQMPWEHSSLTGNFYFKIK